MNRTYDFERRNFRMDGSNCRPIKIVREEENSALDAVGDVIAKLFSGRIGAIVKAAIVVACIIGIIGIVGGIESGAINIF